MDYRCQKCCPAPQETRESAGAFPHLSPSVSVAVQSDIVILAALRRDERRAGLWNSSATVRLTAAVIITGEPLCRAKCLTGSCPEELAAFMALVTDGQKRDAALHGKCQIPTSRTYKLFPPLRQALPGLPEVSVMSWGLILAKRSWLGSRPRRELAEGLPFRF